MDVITQDPINDLYAINGYEELRPYRKSDVEAANYLVRISRGRQEVKTASDWGVLAKVLEFWCRRWPEEWQEFSTTVQDIRRTRARKDGYSREKGKEGVRYLGALPLRLMKLIKVVFPLQQWDRKFVEKFINNIKITRVGEKVDNWFVIPDIPISKVGGEKN
jgi:hypothetical protein